MINEVARMAFQSAKNPNEQGTLVLTDDGFVQMQPSNDFIQELTRLEQDAVRNAATRGNALGALLVGAGLLVLAFAWIAGRIGGEMRETLTTPHSAEDVDVAADNSGAVRVTFSGVGSQRVQMTWAAGETNSAETARFIALHRQFKENAETNARR